MLDNKRVINKLYVESFLVTTLRLFFELASGRIEK